MDTMLTGEIKGYIPLQMLRFHTLKIEIKYSLNGYKYVGSSPFQYPADISMTYYLTTPFKIEISFPSTIITGEHFLSPRPALIVPRAFVLF